MSDNSGTPQREKGVLRLGIPLSLSVLTCWIVLSLLFPNLRPRTAGGGSGLLLIVPCICGAVVTHTKDEKKQKVTTKFIVDWKDWVGLISFLIVIYAILTGVDPITLVKEIRDVLFR